MRAAVIGMGSNSLRMLVADVDHAQKKLEQVLRARDGLRVFASLSSENGGTVSQDMIEHAAMAIANMRRIAEELCTEKIFLYATSATRDCENKDAFIGHIEAVNKLKLEVLSGLEEARYSFLGATFGKTGGVIDIGGGSTEIAVGSRGALNLAYSLQLGAVRLYRTVPVCGPEDVDRAVDRAKELIAPKAAITKEHIQAHGLQELVGVGGTFTSLSALTQNIPWKSYDSIHNYVLDKEGVYQKMCELADMSIEERSQLPSMQPSRADIIVNGAAVLYACMDSFDIKHVRVSTKGNLEGYLIQKYL